MKRVTIPISLEDEYILKTFDNARYLRSFNRSLRGVETPVGPFHQPLHDQALYETNAESNREVSHIANLFSVREPRYSATVLAIFYCETDARYKADVEWREKEPHPLIMRITAVLAGKRCVRVAQFGVE